jgi:CTP synthase (UTP-ammonia lyase)
MEEEHLTIADKQSILYGIMKSDGFTGKYYCHYGLNNEYIKLLQSRGLRTTVLSDDGQVRAIELTNHRFFIGTLFQPALTSSASEPHPLIVEFVRQAINWKVIYL